ILELFGIVKQTVSCQVARRVALRNTGWSAVLALTMPRVAFIEGAARRIEQQRVAGSGGHDAAVFMIQPHTGGRGSGDFTEGTGVARGGAAVGLLPLPRSFVLHQWRFLPVFNGSDIVDAVIERMTPHRRTGGFLHTLLVGHLI